MSPDPAQHPTPRSGTDLTTRLAWLRRFRGAVADARGELADLVESDMGKPARDALVQDVIPLLAACRWLERKAPALLRPRRIGWRSVWTLGQTHEVRRVPLGTVGIIATWNYPLQLLGIQLAHALVAGNRVIVKPSEHSPRCQARLLELALTSGLDRSSLLWTEPTRAAGPRMLREHAFDHLVFTGSTAVGREVAAWAAGTLTPSTLELSGCDSAFVLSDADPLLAARSLWAAVTMNAGQTCMAPRRVMVLRPVYAAFLRALAPLAAGACPVRLVNHHAAARVWMVVESSLKHGTARSISGTAEPPTGNRLTPMALVDCDGSEPVIRGDHFGPLFGVMPVDTLSEALAVHRRCTQHLSASVFTRRPGAPEAVNLAEHLGAGVVTFNDAVIPTGHPGVALSGRAESGWGASRGAEGLLSMTRAVYVSRTSPRLRPPVGPITANAAAAISRLTGWLYGTRGKPAAPRRLSPDADPPTEAAPPGESAVTAPVESIPRPRSRG